MNFYNYLKQRTKPKHVRLADQYVECYQHVKSLSPFTSKDYVKQLNEGTQKLKELEKQIEECGGAVVAGVVSYKNKAVKRFLKRNNKSNLT
jgi:hypothetical protein